MGKKSKKKEAVDSKDSVPGVLWGVSSKLHGISELFKNQGSEALLSDNGAYGVGAVLGDLAVEIEKARDVLETGK